MWQTGTVWSKGVPVACFVVDSPQFGSFVSIYRSLKQNQGCTLYENLELDYLFIKLSGVVRILRKMAVSYEDICGDK